MDMGRAGRLRGRGALSVERWQEKSKRVRYLNGLVKKSSGAKVRSTYFAKAEMISRAQTRPKVMRQRLRPRLPSGRLASGPSQVRRLLR